MKKNNRLLKLMYAFTLVCFLLITINVFIVTIFKIHPRSLVSLKPYVETSGLVSSPIYAKRGNILDRNGNVVAQDVPSYDIICVLDKNRLTNEDDAQYAYVKDPAMTAKVLAEILGGDEATFFSLLNQKNIYQTELGDKGRSLSSEVKEKIEKLKLPGIEFRSGSKRYYNLTNFSPYVVGYTQINDQGKVEGKMGIESQFDEYLKGTDGFESYEKDNNGFVLPGMRAEKIDALDGKDIYLTLDKSVQEAMNLAIAESVKIFKPIDVWASVVEIDTGKILGWGQYPTYDQNKLNIKDFLNRGTQYTYEPGSTFKAIVYSSAMDLGVYDGNATFDSGLYCYTSDSQGNPKRTYNGDYYDCVANFNYADWGTITFDDGLIRSSNVATSTLLADYVGTKRFYDYVDKFGFFKPVDTDGFIEEVGTHNYHWAAEKLNMTFGQGISTTMLHMVQAYTAIFGNGEMVKPYFVDKIVDPNTSETVFQNQRTVVSKPISKEAARRMQLLMSRVVTDEYGSRHYGIDEVNVMAKTGTSQVANEKGEYDKDIEIMSIMYGFPVENPKYILYYATKADLPSYAHIKNTPPRHLLKKLVKILNVNSYKPKIEEGVSKIVENKMPNLVNDSLVSAKEKLADFDLDIHVLGNGDNIIKQFPDSNESVYTGQKVFLLTSNNDLKMPDMTGWSRKEVTAFWKISNIEFVFKGVGVVKKQSIEAGTTLKKGDLIEIILEDIHKKELTPIKEDIELDN